MDTYGILRELADSWVLLLMTLIFLGMFLWAWRPGSRKTHDDIANSIFRNEKKPATGPGIHSPSRQPTKEA